MYSISIIQLYYYANRLKKYVRIINYIRFCFQTDIAEIFLLLNYHYLQSGGTIHIHLLLDSVLKMESYVIMH
jgi:hypothetical protein